MKASSFVKLLSIVLLSCILTVPSSAAVSSVVGASADATGFVPFPTVLTVLCPVGGGANCPETFAPSWGDSTRYWGEDGVGNCVTSTDSGDTWALCTAQPFAGTAMRIASSSNGSLVAVSSVAGTCTIRRSVDNGAIWTTEFTDANSCNMAAGAGQMMICQQTGGRCDYIFTSTGVNLRAYQTTDDGDTWVQTVTANINFVGSNSLAFNGTEGVASPTSGATGRVVPVASGGVWAASSGWGAGTVNYVCSGANRFSDVGDAVFCYDVGALNYRQISPIGGTDKTFTPTGALQAGSPFLNAVEWAANTVYICGVNTSGNQRFWASLDNFSTFVTMTDIGATAGICTMYNVNGGIFISTAGTTGAFYRIAF